MTPDEQLIDDIAQFVHDPYGCARYSFPWREDGDLQDSSGPRVWQRHILMAIGQHLQSERRFDPLKIAVASGHGIGKSALISIITHWAMSTCTDCRVIMTANTEVQLRTKTWPEVTKWFRSAINSDWYECGATTITVKDKRHAKQWRVDAVPWSENNTEAFAGLHNKGKRLVVIFDEASKISDSIWEVTEGALTDSDTEIIWIAFGNPTRNTGRFRECFGAHKHRWVCQQIDSRNVEGTNQRQIQQWIDDWGEDSDFVRVRVRGEFPRAGSDQFIDSDVVHAARKRTLPTNERDWRIMSVDVARFGDDQTVVGIKQGSKFRIVGRYRGLDTMQVSMRCQEIIKRETPRLVVIDGDGVGGGVVDHIKMYMDDWFKAHSPSRLVEFHGGASPADAYAYYNKRAEVWGRMREWLKDADIPDDPDLYADLTGVEYGYTNKNQLQLEKKEDMKKRGLSSPDAGDCLAMCFAHIPAPRTSHEKYYDRMDAASPAERMMIAFKHSQPQKGSKPKCLPSWKSNLR